MKTIRFLRLQRSTNKIYGICYWKNAESNTGKLWAFDKRPNDTEIASISKPTFGKNVKVKY